RFDVRTQVLRNGAPAAVKDIRPGQRVYVDTMLNGDQVFAKSIRLETGADQGDARGQVVTIDPARGILELHEEIAREPFRFRLSKETTVLIDGRRAAPANVLPGALVTIVFVGGATSGVAREIHVLANPGQHFTFAGKITFLDLRLKRFAILNRSDGQTYDIALSQLGTGQSRGLRVGSEAIVKAVFNGKNYEAQNIEMSTSGNNQARQ
ncbi:MAG: hypothetical protein JOZ36_08425, partial [Acidobacteria bacterium]|nr:hypothetical protein [Acidobacteriota bacterium]